MTDELEDISLSEISQLQKDKHCTIALCEESKRVKCIEAESRMIVAGAEGRGNGDLLFGRYKHSVKQDEQVLEICCTTLCLWLIIWHCALKNLRQQSSCYVFLTIKKKEGCSNTIGYKLFSLAHLIFSLPLVSPEEDPLLLSDSSILFYRLISTPPLFLQVNISNPFHVQEVARLAFFTVSKCSIFSFLALISFSKHIYICVFT